MTETLGVLRGIAAAKAAGIAVKINTVALKGLNETEIPTLVEWAHAQGHDLTLIEVLPLGEVDGERVEHYLPLPAVRDRLEQRFTLDDIADQTGGPARYVRVAQTGGRLGFITPLTNNFCATCNRIRVTATGQLYACLGGAEQVVHLGARLLTKRLAAGHLADAGDQRALGRRKVCDLGLDEREISNHLLPSLLLLLQLLEALGGERLLALQLGR